MGFEMEFNVKYAGETCMHKTFYLNIFSTIHTLTKSPLPASMMLQVMASPAPFIGPLQYRKCEIFGNGSFKFLQIK